MKQEINPAVGAVVVGLVLLIIGWFVWRYLFPPATLPPLPDSLRPEAFGGPPSAPPSAAGQSGQ
jgi:hypothetical protein